MELVVGIRDGNIVIAKSRGGAQDTFQDAVEAAEHLAYKIANNASPVTFDRSCVHPALHGRPGFRLQDFREDLQFRIRGIEDSMRSMAA